MWQSVTIAAVEYGAADELAHAAGERGAARLVAVVARRAVVVERAAHVEDDRRAAAAARERVVGVHLELVAAEDRPRRVADGDVGARVLEAIDLRAAGRALLRSVVPVGKFMQLERSTTSKPSRFRFWLFRRNVPSGLRATPTSPT